MTSGCSGRPGARSPSQIEFREITAAAVMVCDLETSQVSVSQGALDRLRKAFNFIFRDHCSPQYGSLMKKPCFSLPARRRCIWICPLSISPARDWAPALKGSLAPDDDRVRLVDFL